ncbi:MAG: PAS domain S-box protein [Gemmatimonadaceae bacterium]
MSASDSLGTPSGVEDVAADAVRLLSQRGEMVLNAVDDGIYCLDASGRTTFVNEAATRMLGYTLREMIGKPQHALIHHHYPDGSEFPEEACPIWGSVSEGIHQRVGGDVFWRKDGSALPVDYTSTPIREGRRVVAVVVTFRDVTAEQAARQQLERLAAERAAREEAERGRRALEESEERFRLALDAGQMGTWEWDIVGERVYWSPQQERMYGLEPGRFSGTLAEYQQRIHPDDRADALNLVQSALAEHAQTHHVRHRIIRPDGEIRWLDSHGRFIYSNAGDPIRLTGVSTDVTEQQLADERVRERDARFQALIAATGQIIWTNTPEGRMTGEEPGWSAFTGQNASEYKGFGWSDAVHPDDREPTVNAWNAAVAARKMFVFEHRVRRHDGVYRRFAIRAVPVLENDGTIREWVGSHTDVTEQSEAAEARDRARSELALAFEQAPAGIATLDGPDHIVRTANPAFLRLIGRRAVIGRPIREAFPDLEGQPFFDLLDGVFHSCQAWVGERVTAMYDRHGNGIREAATFNIVYQPLIASDGQCIGILVHAVELT